MRSVSSKNPKLLLELSKSKSIIITIKSKTDRIDNKIKKIDERQIKAEVTIITEIHKRKY